jgi:hypothetical protein
MGDYKHVAIVVTGFRVADVERAAQVAQAAGCVTTPVTESPCNTRASLLVVPHGAKLGGGLEREHDEARSTFVAWLRTAEAAGLEWCEVAFGNIVEGAEVTRHAWEPPER